jgi:tetratricopeptide (TPR) repeat protein
LEKLSVKRIIFILFLCWPVLFHAQTKAEKLKAKKLVLEAISFMDKGEYEKSIEILARAEKLDPTNLDCPYETAYAYYAMKEYKKARDILKNLTDHKDVSSMVFQLLGNTYDMLGDQDLAMKTYKSGLEKFPNAGNLYLEIGVVLMSKDSLNQALNSFERGIFFDPDFPSNYYWAARFYLSSEEEVWGMLYGEIFMNLERGSKRTAEMSKLLYNTYQNEIHFEEDGMAISFSKSNTIVVGDGEKLKFPFPTMAYEPTLLLSLVGQESINLASLNHVRDNFITFYYAGKLKDEYPNVLFDYHKKLQELGFFEAYNYWLLMKGDEAAFTAWQEKNQASFEAFVNWYVENPLKLDEKHRFHSSFY